MRRALTHLFVLCVPCVFVWGPGPDRRRVRARVRGAVGGVVEKRFSQKKTGVLGCCWFTGGRSYTRRPWRRPLFVPPRYCNYSWRRRRPPRHRNSTRAKCFRWKQSEPCLPGYAKSTRAPAFVDVPVESQRYGCVLASNPARGHSVACSADLTRFHARLRRAVRVHMQTRSPRCAEEEGEASQAWV